MLSPRNEMLYSGIYYYYNFESYIIVDCIITIHNDDILLILPPDFEMTTYYIFYHYAPEKYYISDFMIMLPKDGVLYILSLCS